MRTAQHRTSGVLQLCAAMALLCVFGAPACGEDMASACAKLPFTMRPPEIQNFPSTVVDISTCGAVPDGITLNTTAIQNAITACAKAGGGTVNVPPGTWRTGPIRLESNTCLNVQRGALVLFSSRLDDFPLIPRADDSAAGYLPASPIWAQDAENIGITGNGIIDGSGEAWRYVLREKQTEREWNDLVASGGVLSADGKQWWPSADARDGETYVKTLRLQTPHPQKEDFEKAKRFLRPDLVRFVRCSGILIDGPTFRNSPKFHLHPIQCENIVIQNVNVFAPWFGMNADGIDLSSCRNVIVWNSTLSVGDDGICLKPARLSPLQKPGPACMNILIAGCTVYRAHGGFVIGSESFGGVKNVAVRNCTFIYTDVGIRVKSARGRGGLVEDVSIDNVQMSAIAQEAILFDMYYTGNSPEVESTKDRSMRLAEPVTARTPMFRNFSVRNVVCIGAARAILVNGLPEFPIRQITFDSVVIEAKQGITCIDATDITFANCRITAAQGPAAMLNECVNVSFEKGTYRSGQTSTLRVEGKGSRGIRYHADQPKGNVVMIERGDGVATDALYILDK